MSLTIKKYRAIPLVTIMLAFWLLAGLLNPSFAISGGKEQKNAVDISLKKTYTVPLAVVRSSEDKHWFRFATTGQGTYRVTITFTKMNKVCHVNCTGKDGYVRYSKYGGDADYEYNIYRFDSTRRAVPAKKPITGYYDFKLKGHTYYYIFLEGNDDTATVRIDPISIAKDSQKNKPYTPSLYGLKSHKKAVTVRWTKSNGAAGYQIRYKLSHRKYKKYKTVTVKGGKKTSRKIKNLKKSKYYYIFQVRAYKKVKGKTYYSSWSTWKPAYAK